MSVSAAITKSVLVGGVSFPEGSSIASDGAIVHNVSVPGADAGALTTRTNDTDGIITADDSGHGISTGDRVDIYWDGGSRRGVTVGTVSGAEIPISGGAGDVLPAQDTELDVALCVELDVAVLGTNVKAIILYSAQRGQFVFVTTGPTEQLAKEVGDGNGAVVWIWHEHNGEDNPIDGDAIIAVYVSHAGAAAADMRLGIVYAND